MDQAIAQLAEQLANTVKASLAVHKGLLLASGEDKDSRQKHYDELQQMVQELSKSIQALTAGPRAGEASSAAEAKVNALDARLRQLVIQMNKASLTTQDYEDIGKLHLEDAQETAALPDFGLAVGLKEPITTACSRFAEAYPSPGCLTLRGAAEHLAGGSKRVGESHMQKVAMCFIKFLAEEVGRASEGGQKLFPVDTHASGLRPYSQQGLVDCSIIAMGTTALWTSLVAACEFKVHSTDLVAALGQLIARCQQLFERQASRQFVYAMGMSLDEVQIFRLSKACQAGIRVEASGRFPMTIGYPAALIAPDGCVAVGVQKIAHVLAGTLEDLGYKSPETPPCVRVQDAQLHGFRVVQQNIIRKDKTVSDVYFAQLGDEEVVVKRFCNPREIAILERSQESSHPHCIKLVAILNASDWVRRVDGKNHVTAVLAPVCDTLQRNAPVALVAQVAADIASAISHLLKLNIQHRDISANNIGVYKERGILYDFSASKDVIEADTHSEGGAPTQVTGTPMFVAYSLLSGGKVHTESTHLESLYYSVRYCTTGSLPDAWVFQESRDVERWACVRLGFMARATKQGIRHVNKDTERFLFQLHGLFWPPNGDCEIKYRSDVTVEEFTAVCMSAAESHAGQVS